MEFNINLQQTSMMVFAISFLIIIIFKAEEVNDAVKFIVLAFFGVSFITFIGTSLIRIWS